MDRLIYTALSGMRRAEYAQALTANNLANTATVGFQRDSGTFQSRWIEDGQDTRVQASEQITTTAVEPGTVATTARPLDIALHAGALLAVQTPGGGEAYTRRGDLQLTPEGKLTTGDGRPVLGGGGPVTIPPQSASRSQPTAPSTTSRSATRRGRCKSPTSCALSPSTAPRCARATMACCAASTAAPRP